MIVTDLLAPAPITGVDFDAAALRLSAASAGHGLLDLSAGPCTRTAALRLHVTPIGPAGPVVMVFGGNRPVSCALTTTRSRTRSVPCSWPCGM